MNAQNWTDTLNLLCMMILSDEPNEFRARKAFQKAALALKDQVAPNVMLTEEMARDWFLIRKKDLTRKMSSLLQDQSITATLNNLNAVPDKQGLIVAMMKLVFSNDQDQGPENHVVERAAQAWALDLPLAS
jgi:hypothetical protein